MKEWILKTSTVIIALFAPIHAMIIATGTLIVVDTFFGVWAAKKRGEEITSAGLRRTLTKMLVYQLTILTGFVVETWLISGMFPVSKLVAGVIGLVEFKSLLENVNTINGSPIFKDIITKLGSSNDK